MSRKLHQSDIVGHILDEFRAAIVRDEAFSSAEADSLDQQLRKKYPPSNKKLDEILALTKKPES